MTVEAVMPQTQADTDVAALQARIEQLEAQVAELAERVPEDRVTIVVFSGELDRLLAAFIIATGALALGQEVSMFFTFWGLNAIRKKRSFEGKSLMEKMLDVMTASPAAPAGMGLSRMNFFGVGASLMKRMMRQKNVETLDDLISLAEEMGATIYSCAMSQHVMGIAQEELRDSAEEAGVAGFLADALKSRVTLFI